MKLEKHFFGITADGDRADLYRLSNDAGMDLAITNFGTRIDNNEEQLAYGKGYDHNWMLNRRGSELILAAKVHEPKFGRTMELHTTEPGLQFYSGNLIGEPVIGKAGQVYRPRCGLCLEPQHFPDSPNQPNLPTTVLKPGDQYRQMSAFKFYVS